MYKFDFERTVTMILGDPIIHDLYKGVIRYRHDDVKKILIERGIKSNLLKPICTNSRDVSSLWSEEELFRVKPKYEWGTDQRKYYTSMISQGRTTLYSELSRCPRIYADVIWRLDFRDLDTVTKCQYIVVNEVKTGRFDVNEIFQKYSEYIPYCKNLNKPKPINQLWIWGQKEYLAEQTKIWKTEIPQFKKGLIRLFPIEWLKPLVTQVLEDNHEWFL